MALCVIRRRVPNDHSCLFWAMAYVAEGADSSRTKARQLREVCAEEALQDPDPATRALLLGHDSVQEYAAWIRNEFHWGGENEVFVLAKHYNVEVAVVDCESLRVHCYNSDSPSADSRVYVLYTGQHYDPLVAGETPDVLADTERRRFTKGDSSLDEDALAQARKHNEEAARKASQRRAKKIKCGGCAALLDDAEAFASHCGEVEHDDDFAYDCEEVEVVIEGDEALPEGAIDLNSPAVHTFNNAAGEPLSNLYPAAVTVKDVSYITLEHYWLSAPFFGSDPDLCTRIVAAPSTEEASIVAQGAGPCSQREDWRESRWQTLLDGLRAKGAQSEAFATALLATGDKTIVSVGTEPWAQMQAPGGITTGQNNMGKALMQVRSEILAARGASS